MTGFAFCVCVVKAWFIHPVGYSVRCRGDRLGYHIVYIDDGLPCDSTSLNGTKYHEIKELVEHAGEEMISSNKR